MTNFRRRTIFESIKRIWPPYRRAQDAATREAIRYLLDNPEAPCTIGDTFVPHGHGDRYLHPDYPPIAIAKTPPQVIDW